MVYKEPLLGERVLVGLCVKVGGGGDNGTSEVTFP
jgi:hypothetical protein